MKKYIYTITSTLYIIGYVLFIIGVGSDTDLGDVERAIRDIAIKGYSYSPDLLDEQLHNVSLMREQERARFLPPVLSKVNRTKAQKILIEKFSDIKKKLWEDYIHHRLPWQQDANHPGGSTGPLTTGGGGGPVIITPSTPPPSTQPPPPPPPNIDKYPILKDDNALKPIVDKINSLRSTVKDEVKKCEDEKCPGNKTSSAPWMNAVNELWKLWDITIQDAGNLSSAIADAAKNVTDKAEFESSLREAIRLKASGNNYVDMKRINEQISGQGFMNDKEKECTKYHNIWRAVMGLPPFSAEEKKVIAARKHSEYMTQKDLTHNEDVAGRETPWARCSQEGTTCNAENVAKGTADPKQTLDRWLSSAGHHRNIIGPYSKIGIGFAEPYWWTAVFGP